jgi:hypothetical protein
VEDLERACEAYGIKFSSNQNMLLCFETIYQPDPFLSIAVLSYVGLAS